MFRGLRLPGKMTLAAVPLILALTATAALLVRGSFDEADRARDAAVLAGSLDDLSVVLSAIRDEAEPFANASVGATGDPARRAATDTALDTVRLELSRVGSTPLLLQLDRAVKELVDLRIEIDRGISESDVVSNRIPVAYEGISNEFQKITSLMPVEVASVEVGREFEALAAISRARLAAGIQDRIILEEVGRVGVPLSASIDRVGTARVEIEEWLSVFQAAASGEVRSHFAQSGIVESMRAADARIDVLLEDDLRGLAITQEEWTEVLDARWEALVEFEADWSERVVEESAAEAARATQNAWIVAGAAIGAMLLAAIATALVSRSIVRRVRTVTDRARLVSQEHLPALVDALRDPSEDAALPTMPPIRDRGADEVGDLARSFAAMQSTLEDVARQQMETLHKGVADMFVTLARRNRSLIDRQLALIDQLEAHEEDPSTLSDFYRLDHLATRMRRNAESLLVLAGSETPRAWQRPLEIDDVVRAAVGEVEDYRRVDILALEGLKVRGAAVADVSHLLSELLENATSFSAPETRVRVAGHFHEDGYLLTISDRGVGLGDKRLMDLNRLLQSPPVVGLALEPTLGLYVVAMLSKRHGISVRLVPGAPGVTAQIVLPKVLFEVEPSKVTDAPAAPPEAEPSPMVEGDRFELRRRARHLSVHLAERPDSQETGSGETEEPSPPAVEPSRGDGAPGAEPYAPLPGADAEISDRKTPAEAIPSSPAPTINGLPSRVPGASLTESLPARPVAPSPEPADGLRNALESFQAGRDRAGGEQEAGSLPTRVPGTAFSPADADSGDLTANQSPRRPDTLRSALGAFQTGLETGRRDAQVEEDEA